ncbi:MAG: NrfD/PsrC family molybdoenzyme membrane anchor subunit [Vicinamibacterales bacterium]
MSGARSAEAREARLLEIREEAATRGVVEADGVRPGGAPFPVASPETGYYGRPLLKEPQWKWEVPAYFFVGGAAGAGAIIGAAARVAGGDPALARDARWIAAAGGALSPLLLISDLGRPERFINMLRVFKPQSPMSVGSWTLAAFSTAAASSLFADMLRERYPSLPVRVLGNAAEAAAAGLGLVMASYTGVLIGATAVPVWNRHARTLPVHFTASGLATAVSALEIGGHGRSRALNALAIGAALVETAEGLLIEAETHAVNAPLKQGTSGRLTRAGGALSGPLPLALRCLALLLPERHARPLRRVASAASIAGSLLTRVGWIQAGHASARDPGPALQLEPAAGEPLSGGRMSIT